MKTLLSGLLLALAIALPAGAQAASPAIDTALAAPGRSAADRERDARDKPGELLAFAGAAPGMVVADIFAGGGYYSEILAGIVGPTGKVYAINNIPYASFSKEGIAERYTEGRLGNVERRLVEASYMNVAPKGVDLALIVMAYHDVYWIDEKEGWPEIDTAGFIDSIKRMLKPGGKLLIVDHNAAKGTGRESAGKLHRLNEEWAKKSLTDRGFVLEKTWDGLRNPQDSLDKMVYDPAIKGRTDRYVHLYRLK